MTPSPLAATAALALALGAAPTQAADIVVYGTVAAKAVLQEIAPAYERETHNKLNLRIATTGELKEAIEKGAHVDVAILTSAALDDLVKQGKLDPATKVAIAKSGVGVAVKKGAAVPAIATSELFKQSLLAAKSIAYSAQGATGPTVKKIFERYGIADAMAAKTVIVTRTTAPEAVGLGQAEMGFTQISEILDAKDAQLAGPLPPDVQVYSAFAAAATADTKETAAVQSFLATLTTPATKALLQAKGLEPN